MAVLKVQENIKQEDGSYATVHKETEAGLVLFDDGETFQQKLDAGELRGESGSDGKSPYQAAVDAGYTGTEAEFYAALVALQNAPFVPKNSAEIQVLYGNIGLSSNVNPNFVQMSIRAPGGGFASILKLAPSYTGSGLTHISGVENPESDYDSANKKYVDDAVANAGGGNYLPLSGGDMSGDIDMQNHVITGLPSPVAPSDAVNFQTLINAIAGKINYAKIILSGVNQQGNYASMSNFVLATVEGTYSTDTILKIDHTIQYEEMRGNGLLSINKIDVELSPTFKGATTGDWSYIPGYSPILAATLGSRVFEMQMANGYSITPVVYTTGNINNIADNIRINGYVKVGVDV